jgi:CBS domain-containing protein
MNTIATQIADFKEFTPFDHLTFQELAEIAGNIRVINLEKIKPCFK